MSANASQTAKDIDVLCVGMVVYDVMAKPVDEIPDWGRLVTSGVAP